MRVTIDAAILVRAFVSPRGPAARLLSDLKTPQHRIVLSVYILDELERVLSYPRIQVAGIRVMNDVLLIRELLLDDAGQGQYA